MSLDSTTVATAGSIAAPIATMFGPVGMVAGLAIAAGTQYAAAEMAADEQRELTERNATQLQLVQKANEVRQRRIDAAVRGRFRQRVAASGFTMRGTPLEVMADVVAEQEELIQIDRWQAKMGIEDLRIRGEYAARQTQAEGFAGFASGMGQMGRTILSRIDPGKLYETA
jgi:hypothetical protein